METQKVSLPPILVLLGYHIRITYKTREKIQRRYLSMKGQFSIQNKIIPFLFMRSLILKI